MERAKGLENQRLSWHWCGRLRGAEEPEPRFWSDPAKMRAGGSSALQETPRWTRRERGDGDRLPVAPPAGHRRH